MSDAPPPVFPDLRRRADAMTTPGTVPPADDADSLSPEDVRRTLHDLRTHQIELELQNEELRRMQAELDASRARYFDLYDRAPVGYLTLGANGLILDANLTVATLLDVPRSQLVQRRLSQFVSDEDQTPYYLLIRQLFDSRAPQTCDLRMAKQSGTIFWAHLTAIVTPDAAGAPTCRMTLSDISARKHADAETLRAVGALRASEAQYRALFEQANEGLLILGLDGHVFKVNRAFAEMHGYQADELTTMDITALDVLREDALVSRANILGRILAGETVRFDVEHFHKDGHAFPISVTSSLVEIDGQRFYQAFHQDITERRRIEAELETGKRELELFFGLVPDLVCIASVDGFFLKLGGAWKQTLGFTNAELLAQPFESFMHPEDIAATREEVLTQLGGGSTAKFVNRYRTKAGDYRWLEWTASPAVNGATLYAAARDITDRKRAEEEKAVLEARSRQAQKMESVGLLAGGVAHDFNNMLAVILGHTEVAMEGIDSAQQLHASLDEIHKAATRSANLTRQLLAFARKETITPKVIDLNETMAGTLSMIRRLVGENVHVAWQPHADLWPVQIDASQMEQVLINLCVNARAAIAGVGSITIATDNAVDDADWSDVANEVRGDYVRLTVSDTGCGMSGETLSHIFEPFFTTKAVGEGTGMGLASVFGAVKQNRGVIQVRSVLGTGTTFRIYLPRHTATVAPSGTDVEMVPTLRGHETLLLVEDEPGVLMLAKKALERSGYTVLAAGTPSEAIRLATEYGGHIHLLMTDVVMPEMNGLALATRLDAIRPHIKRLFTSGYPADVIADHGVVDHSAAFISKPFSIKALVAKVRETLDRD